MSLLLRICSPPPPPAAEVEATESEPLLDTESSPDNEPPTSEIQLEPTQEEMERERLIGKAEQVLNGLLVFAVSVRFKGGTSIRYI